MAAGEHPLLWPPDVDYDAAWSADGAWIAFTSERNGSADIYRVNPDGIRPRTAHRQSGVRRSGGLLARWPADRLRDDARRAALPISGRSTSRRTARRRSPQGPAATSARRGRRMANGSPSRRIAAPACRSRTAAGKRCTSPTSISIHPDGSGVKRITDQHGALCGSPKWSADSRRVIAYCNDRAGDDGLPAGAGSIDGGSTRARHRSTWPPANVTEVSGGPGVKMAPAFVGGERHRVHPAKTNRPAFSIRERQDLDRKGTCARRCMVAGRPRVARSTRCVDGRRPDHGKPMWSRLPAYDLRLGGMQPSFDPSGDALRDRPTTCRRRSAATRCSIVDAATNTATTALSREGAQRARSAVVGEGRSRSSSASAMFGALLQRVPRSVPREAPIASTAGRRSR